MKNVTSLVVLKAICIWSFFWVLLVACDPVKPPDLRPPNSSQVVANAFTPTPLHSGVSKEAESTAVPPTERTLVTTTPAAVAAETMTAVPTNNALSPTTVLSATATSLGCPLDTAPVDEWISSFGVDNIFRMEEVFLVYGTEPAYEAPLLQTIRERDIRFITSVQYDFFANSQSSQSAPELLHFRQINERSCQRLYAIYGTPWSNPLVRMSLAQIPALEVRPGQVTIEDRIYTGENLQLVVAGSNPFNHDRPVIIVTGAGEQAIENAYINAQRPKSTLVNYLLTREDFLVENGNLDWPEGAIRVNEVGLTGVWEMRESEHFRIYFRPNSVAQTEIDFIIRTQEEAYERINHSIGWIDDPVNVYLYKGPLDKLLATGYEECCGQALPWFNSVHSLYTAGTKAIGGHETVHVIAYHNLGHPSVQVLSEGLAVYLSAPGDNFKPEHEKVNALQEQGDFIPLAMLIDNRIFWRHDGQVTYTESGSFVKFLVEAYGIDKFKRLYREANMHNIVEKLEEIYELPLDTLEAAWLDAAAHFREAGP